MIGGSNPSSPARKQVIEQYYSSETHLCTSRNYYLAYILLKECYILISMQKNTPLVSVEIPVFNEALGIEDFHHQLIDSLKRIVNDSFEIIYCDDGSTDRSREIISQLCDKHTKLVALSRNFGKEYAVSAAMSYTSGEAVIIMDADGQHPINALPEFISEWKKGVAVIVGRRSLGDSESLTKRFSSRLFYSVLNRLSNIKTDPRDTDFRLLDRVVVNEFLKLSETDRMNRGLIDWLGFTRSIVHIDRTSRIAGNPTYSTKKLIKLAIDSLVSLSSRPLYLLCIIGGLITISAGLLGLLVLLEQVIFSDPLQWNFTGTAMLGILTLFLVGIIIFSQGITSVYVATVYNQVKGRSLYVIDYKKSVGIIDHADRR